MRTKRRQSKKHGRPALIIILLVLVIGGGLLGVHLLEQRERAEEAAVIAARNDDALPEQLKVYYNGAWYRVRDDLETYLIMGIDKTNETLTGEEDALFNNQQADFLFLMIVDKTRQSYSAIHLNRDTMTEVTRLGMNGSVIGTRIMQLCLAHTYGSGGKDSCRNEVKAVSRYLYDVPIDHYVAVTMDGIPVLNDLVDGVTVRIEDDLTPINPDWVPGAEIHLMGEDALRFVRTRWYVTEGSNLNRMVRQRTYINGLYEQMTAKLQGSSTFALKLATALSDYTTSDLITDEMSQLADRLKDYTFTGIATIDGEAIQGAHDFMEFYTDEAQLERLVISTFFELMPT